METCNYPECPETKLYSRKLCRPHYDNCRKYGDLEQYAAPKIVKPEHRLTNKDLTIMTAVCAICGPVEIHKRTDGSVRCKNKAQASWDRMAAKRYRFGEDQLIPISDATTAREQLQTLQNGLCVICNSAFSEQNPSHLDHCHDTGTIRGLLCRSCNWGLGDFKDNIELLESAITYLKRFL